MHGAPSLTATVACLRPLLVMLSLTLLPAISARADTNLAAAVLPTSRSVQVGDTATLFATIINAGAETATGCRIEIPDGLGASFSYQTTDPLTNRVTGSANTQISIPAGGAQSFVVAMTPAQAVAPTDVKLGFLCDNAPDVGTITGVNTFTFSASAAPVSDLVALALTPSADGIITVPRATNSAAFSVASVNLGAPDTLTVTADSTAASVAGVVSLCETNPVTGDCINPTTPTTDAVTTTVASDATPTFAVFVTATDLIEFAPDVNRIAVQFADASGELRGATSVAVRSQEIVDITSADLLGTTMWGVPPRADRVNWAAYAVQFAANNTGVSFENRLADEPSGRLADVAKPFTWEITDGQLRQTFSNSFTVQTAADDANFVAQVADAGLPAEVIDFLLERLALGTLVGPFELQRNFLSRITTATALENGRLRVTALTTTNFSLDEALAANGWSEPFPTSPATVEPSETLNVTSAATVAAAAGQTAVAGDVWAVPFPYSPQDPSLLTPAPVGYLVDTLELLADGTTAPGRLSGRSFSWANDGTSLVLEDGDERHRVTTLALRGDERQAIVEYFDGGELVLVSGLRIALGDNADFPFTTDLLAHPPASNLPYWQAGISSWRAAAEAADGRLLISEIFGYVFPDATTSFRVFGSPAELQACNDATLGCFGGGSAQPWNWVGDGNLITQSRETNFSSRVRTWEVLSYQPGGLAVVVESAVWTFNGGEPEIAITPRINTLELLDLGDYPAELANSPDLLGGTDPVPDPGGNDGGTDPAPDPGGNDGGSDPLPDPGGNDGGTDPVPDPGGNDGGTDPAPDPGGNDGGTDPAPDPGGNDGGTAVSYTHLTLPTIYSV